MLKTKCELIIKEAKLKTSRSGGKGGQHVNKISSKVMLFFDVSNSACLSENEKLRLLKKLKSSLVKDFIIQVVAEEERNQVRNREIAEKKLIEIIKKALKKRKKRKPTKPTKSSIEKRLKSKKLQSEKKERRKI